MKKDKIVVGGAGGFLGGALCGYFESKGWEVVRLSRKAGSAAYWDPGKGVLDCRILEGARAVVCLAGESIFSRWTAERKKAILDSRINSVRVLTDAFPKLREPPEVFMCASACGYYGARNFGACSYESSPKGEGFLADVCGLWEKAAFAASDIGIRTFSARFAPILGLSGGMLALVAKLARFGLAVYFGPGEGRFSWISIGDALRAAEFCIADSRISGAVNFCAPEAPAKSDFARIVGGALGARLAFKIPSFAVGLFTGDMGRELLLSDIAVVPKKLESLGFRFESPNIDAFVKRGLK